MSAKKSQRTKENQAGGMKKEGHLTFVDLVGGAQDFPGEKTIGELKIVGGAPGKKGFPPIGRIELGGVQGRPQGRVSESTPKLQKNAEGTFIISRVKEAESGQATRPWHGGTVQSRERSRGEKLWRGPERGQKQRAERRP